MPFAFFLTCDHRQSTMAAELPPSRFRSSGSLASLRRLMGWPAPGFKHRLKRGTTLLATMPTLDDIDIAVVQRGDLSRGMTISEATVTGGRCGTTGGGRGGRPVGSGLAGGGLAGGRGRGGSGSPSSAPALGKGKGVSVRVIHDDDEVSFDEDEPLQARLRSLFSAGGSSSLGTASPDVVGVKAAGAEVATDRRAAEEAAVKEAADEGSSVFGQAPSSTAGAKRVATPSGSSPQGCLETSVCPKVIAPWLFCFFLFFLRGSLL
jgi:hypothetical protein